MPETKAEAPEREPTTSKKEKELIALKARRTVCEQQIARAQEFVNKVTDVKLTSKAELSIRLDALVEAFNNFSSIQAKIEERDLEEILKPNRSEYEEMYYLVAGAFKVIIQSNKGENHTAEEHGEKDKYNAIRLPKIELHSFSGEVTEWIGWYDKFISLVHDNQHLNTLAKFHHLVSKLEGTAASTIDGLKIVKDNYEVALQRLRERFENKKVIGKKYIELIFEHPRMTRRCVTDLQGIIDKMNNYMSGLKNLGRPVDQWDDLMVHIITSKLDADTALKWKEDSPTDRLSTLAELMTFLKKRCQVLDNMQINLSEVHHRDNNSIKLRRPNKAFTTTQLNCHFCHKPGHFIYRCLAFLNLSTALRIQKVRSLKLCENCLKSSGHNAKNCHSKFKCHTCRANHHSLLHQDPDDVTASTAAHLSLQNHTNQINNVSPLPYTYNATTSSSNSSPTVALHSKLTDGNILGTVIVELVNHLNQAIPCRALLDSGSQINMISEKIVRIAGLKRQNFPTQFTCANNTQSSSKYKTSLTIKSTLNDFSVTLEASIIPQITGLLPDNKIDITNWKIPANIKLADPFFNIPQKIDLLIGVDIFYDIMSIGQIRLGDNLPIAQNTLLGWIIAGKLPISKNSSLKCNLSQHMEPVGYESSLDKSIQAFWNTENFEGTPTNLTSQEMMCEKHFINNVTRFQNGRYQVRLPFISPPTSLGNSYDIALKRFFALERRLSKNQLLYSQYKDFMNEFINLSQMQLATQADLTKPHYIIPHHCVLKPSSSTTKLRVVFDASAKTSTGKSLNDLLMVGPVIQDDLFAILLRFRFYKYVFTADITKMYRQVVLHPDDRCFHYVLWRPSKDAPISLYELNTVTYGTAPASFLATRALKQLATDEELNYPLASRTAMKDFYVDDILTGANNLKDAIILQHQLRAMLLKGGLDLKKWCANHEDLLKDIPDSDKEKLCSINGKNAIKTLGMLWDMSTDKFLYNKSIPNDVSSTKRSVLSEIAKFFDPLGLINPVIVLAKIFMQQLWRLKLHWDAALPQEYHNRWLTFKTQLCLLNQLEIDRRVFADNASYELHAFSDSSELAYGACLYVRSIAQDGSVISVRLLCSKSRVAPLKKCSLPRLELCAAVIMTQLTKRIITIFKQIQFQSVTYWTDSTVVLCWINEESCNWQTFVANRVALIQESSSSSQWRHVPTDLNPADILSRGALPSALIESSMWYNGPSFLLKEPNQWPTTSTNLVHDDTILNRKKMKIVLACQNSSFIETIKYHNNYKKTLNVIAYILRFKNNCREKDKNSKYSGYPTASEIHDALITTIKMIQRTEFSLEINSLKKSNSIPKNSRIKSLAPFIDNASILRVGGRLQYSALDYNGKHPMLLPKSNVFTRALVQYHHIKNHHVGPQALLSIVRQSFWPIHGRIIARSVVHHCVLCSRASPSRHDQLMAGLPELRVQQTRPFNIVGIDFCGPFLVHFRRRGVSAVKAYVAVFVCFVTKATHLELVEDLSTKAFLLALKRFIGRRGRCSVIYSDNATNFIGARNELRELFELFRDQETNIKRACTDEGITWKTIPPRSPHFGGLWEAAVKSFKFHFKRLLKNTSLSFTELNTLIVQIESILNSRPIMAIPENPNDPPALTPGHFIIGTALNAIPEPDMKNIPNVNRLHRYQQLQWYFQQFWDRWHKDYLQGLQVRSKWTSAGTSLKIGDVVTVQEENLAPLNWRLGRITKLHPGKDGVVRVVTVKTMNGEIQRATNKIRRLPV